MSHSPRATSGRSRVNRPSPSISGTAHAQFAEGLHFSAFHYTCVHFYSNFSIASLYLYKPLLLYCLNLVLSMQKSIYGACARGGGRRVSVLLGQTLLGLYLQSGCPTFQQLFTTSHKNLNLHQFQPFKHPFSTIKLQCVFLTPSTSFSFSLPVQNLK